VAGVETGEGLDEVVEYGEGSGGVGDEIEGFGGAKAEVFDALVEQVAESVEVSLAAGGFDEVVVVGDGGLLRGNGKVRG